MEGATCNLTKKLQNSYLQCICSLIMTVLVNLCEKFVLSLFTGTGYVMPLIVSVYW